MRLPVLPAPGLRPAPRGGFAPATLPKPNLSNEEKHERKLVNHRLPPVGRDPPLADAGASEKLARTGCERIKQVHVLEVVSLAGFEVITDGRF